MPSRGRRGGGFPLIAGIILLVIIGVVLWLFLRSGGAGGSVNDNGGGVATSQLGGGAGTLTANGNDLFAIAQNGDSAAFSQYENLPVHADNVPVQAVVGDGTFWVGASDDGRMLVVVNPDQSGSAPTVSSGDSVTLDGTLRVLPVDFASRYGISDSTDQSLLQREGHYIDATRVETNP
jgi:hypothetical protein